MESELGLRVPDGVNVTVLQESPTDVYLVVPPKPAGDRRELSDADLEAVAGGAVLAGFDNTLSLVNPCTVDSCFC